MESCTKVIFYLRDIKNSKDKVIVLFKLQKKFTRCLEILQSNCKPTLYWFKNLIIFCFVYFIYIFFNLELLYFINGSRAFSCGGMVIEKFFFFKFISLYTICIYIFSIEVSHVICRSSFDWNACTVSDISDFSVAQYNFKWRDL